MSRPGASAAEWIGHVPATRLRLSVGVVSAVTIALELMLMRVLAIRFWHHFAALIIATALLGFGAGGTLLTLLRPWVLRRARGTLWALAVALAAAILLSLRAGQAVPLNVRFFAWDRGQIWNLLGVELIFLAPLLLCGTIVGTALMDAPERIGGHYAANLVGSGVGGALPALLLGPLTTEQVMGVLVWLAYLAALLLLPWRRRGWVLASAGAGLALVAMQCFWPWSPGMSQYKLLPQLRLRGDVETLHRSESLLGRVEVVAGPSIHYVPPGRSLNAPDPVPEAALILIDGDPAGPVYNVRSAEGFGFLDWTLSAVAYRLLERPRTLILGADGGRAVGLALFHGARRIVAVEPNRQIVSAMEGPLRRRGGWIWRQQAVEVHNVQARGYLAAARERFDLIHLPFLWVSAIGVDATRAEYLLTVEAFEKMLSRLGPGGVIVAACESRTPPRGGLRLLATAAEALRRSGRDPRRHLAMIRHVGTVAVLCFEAPLDAERLRSIRAFCRQRGFDLCYLPDMAPDEANRHHVLQRPYYYEGARALLGRRRDEYVRRYFFDLRPATDNRPYFYHFLRPRAVPEMVRRLGSFSRARLELGYVLAVVTFAQSLPVAAVLILLPLAVRGFRLRSAGAKSRALVYFLLIGLGFMFLEMHFLQRLSLYLADPLYSASVVIGTFLVFAGLGSRLSGRWRAAPSRVVRRAGLIVAGASAAYLLALTPVLERTLSWPMWGRVLLAVGVMAPPALAMGQMLPAAMRRLARTRPVLVPWCWGVNGFASVAATTGATLLAMELGFAAVAGIGAGCYVLAALMGFEAGAKEGPA